MIDLNLFIEWILIPNRELHNQCSLIRFLKGTVIDGKSQIWIMRLDMAPKFLSYAWGE